MSDFEIQRCGRKNACEAEIERLRMDLATERALSFRNQIAGLEAEITRLTAERDRALDRIAAMAAELEYLHQQADKYGDGIGWIQRAMQAEKELDALRAENGALKDRLEIDHDAPGWDGIACRNETIRIQDELIDGLTSGIPLLVETNKRLMDVTDRLCAALEVFTHPKVKSLVERAINTFVLVGTAGPEFVSWVDQEKGSEK